ncbi:MAG TPA: DNA repair exonuclease, partial [Devosia sp.]
SDARDWRSAMGRIEAALGAARNATHAPHLVTRLQLNGRTAMAWRLRRDRDLLLAETEQRAEGLGQVWIEKIEIATEAPSQASNSVLADPVNELGELMRRDILTAPMTLADVKHLVEDLRSELPAEIRNFPGSNEAELDSFVELLLAEGSADILARLRSNNAGTD